MLRKQTTQFTLVKNYEKWLAVDNVMGKIIRLTFLAHPVVLVDNTDHQISVEDGLFQASLSLSQYW